MAQTLHEVRTDGEVDEMAMRNESRSDERFAQLSVLTKCISILYYYTSKGLTCPY